MHSISCDACLSECKTMAWWQTTRVREVQSPRQLGQATAAQDSARPRAMCKKQARGHIQQRRSSNRSSKAFACLSQVGQTQCGCCRSRGRRRPWISQPWATSRRRNGRLVLGRRHREPHLVVAASQAEGRVLRGRGPGCSEERSGVQHERGWAHCGRVSAEASPAHTCRCLSNSHRTPDTHAEEHATSSILTYTTKPTLT